ncbi:MAG: suppressor of fused domain protein [Streptosporangiales bacterium]|nr:suppressor of fused domain protein [Streptosporangiales bacterium]
MAEEQAQIPEGADGAEDPVEEAWREAIEAHCDRYLGPCPNVVAETGTDLVRIDLDPYLPAHNRERTTVVTVGVSTKATSAPDAMASYRHIELFTYLPSNWSYGTDEAHWWPCRMLKDVGRLVHRLETWYAPGQLLGGDPDEPLTDETLLTGVVLLPPVYEDPAFDQLEIDGASCRFLWAFPLTTPEIEFAQDRGVSRLLELMAERDVQLPLDSRRACMITGDRYGQPSAHRAAPPADEPVQHTSHPSQPPQHATPQHATPQPPQPAQHAAQQQGPPAQQQPPQQPPPQRPPRQGPPAQPPPQPPPQHGPYGGGPPAQPQGPYGAPGPQYPQPYAPSPQQPPPHGGTPHQAPPAQPYGPPQQGGYGPPPNAPYGGQPQGPYGRPPQGPPQQYGQQPYQGRPRYQQPYPQQQPPPSYGQPPGPQYGPPPGQAPGPYGGPRYPQGPPPQPRPPQQQGPPQQGPPPGSPRQSPELWNRIHAGVEQRLDRLLQTEGFLVVEESSTGYYVMLASSRKRSTLTCEAVSNQFLPTGRRLSPEQEQRMRALGWSPPGTGEASGTWNHARTLPMPVRAAGVARVVVATLRDIYGCDPRRLSYTGNPTAVADMNEPFHPDQ